MAQRILVVEDEPTILDLVAQVLSEEGYSVTMAANGAVALDTIATSEGFDLVVLDMWMPQVNGWQFASALVERKIRLPLLVMTAASEARVRAEDVGAIGFIGKPFDVDQLVLAVSHALASGGGSMSTPTLIRPVDPDRGQQRLDDLSFRLSGI